MSRQKEKELFILLYPPGDRLGRGVAKVCVPKMGSTVVLMGPHPAVRRWPFSPLPNILIPNLRSWGPVCPSITINLMILYGT